jgi:hypothetical protein
MTARDLFTTFVSVILSPSAATRRQRRTLGTVILVVVVLMVLLGCFLLKEGIAASVLLLFWGACFLLLFWSLFLAYVDVKSIRRDFLAQRKQMFISTFSSPDFRKKVREKRRARSAPAEAGGLRESRTEAPE